MLLDQFMLELQFDLQDDGFNVSRIDFIGDCRVSADTMYLKRVFDNLLSNLRKYADKSRPVMILSALENGWLSVCVSNYVVRSMNRVESTKIGIRTCEKIMTHMGGSFEIRSDEEHFAAELKLPEIDAGACAPASVILHLQAQQRIRHTSRNRFSSAPL